MKNLFGQSLIEILIAMGLVAILLPALLTGLVASREGKAQEEQRLQATALLREAEDAARSVREQSWSNISSIGIYHPVISGSSWSLVSGTESINGYTRQIEIDNVNRDSSGNITDTGGILDASTKKITTTVSWTTPRTSQVESINYFQRYLSNSQWLQTTQADFNAGTTVDTVVVNNAGGEVELSVGGGGGWSTPNIISNFNNGGGGNGNDVFIDGSYAFLATSNSGGNPDLTIIDITNPNSPSQTGGINLGTTVNGVYISGDYAYLATVHNSREFIVVDISNKSSPSQIATLNLNGRQNANMVFVQGSYAYVVRSRIRGSTPEFYIVDVSNPSSPSVVGTLNPNTTISSVYVSGNYAYLATNGRELMIVDITNKSNPTLTGTFNAPSGSNGNDVFVSGSTAYLVTRRSGSEEFYAIDVSNPANPSQLGAFEVNEHANGVFVAGNLAFLANDSGNSNEFLVLDISNPSNIVQIGTALFNSDGNDLFIQGNYAYVASDLNSGELIIIEGGSSSALTGTFESSTFNAGSQVAFNNITFTIAEPPANNIEFQIAVNNDGFTWNFIGPDNTSATFYQIPGAIPLQSINGQYIRYKALFTGDGVSTPILSDVSVNYSP